MTVASQQKGTIYPKKNKKVRKVGKKKKNYCKKEGHISDECYMSRGTKRVNIFIN